MTTHPSKDQDLERAFLEPLAQLIARAEDRDGREAYNDFYAFLATYIAREVKAAEERGASVAAHMINKELGLELTVEGSYYLTKSGDTDGK